MSIIAISRGTFSGGEALAKQVADRLGYPCVSREMNLEAAAKRYGISPEQLSAALDKRPSFWDREGGARVPYYLTLVRAALCEQAQEGRLVYHGYLGHLLLPGISHVIGVRVIADLEFRLEAAMQQQHLARAAALTYIKRVDKERQEWTRFLFEIEWDDPSLYAIILNLSRMALETASEQLVRLTERAEFQPTAASVKALQDLTVSSRVQAALGGDSRTRGADLKVTATDGIVTITGSIPREITDAVSSVVRQVEGVKGLNYQVKEATTLPPID